MANRATGGQGTSATTLETYIAQARKNGAVRVDTPGGEVYVVATRNRGDSAPAPFAGAQRLLDPPIKRAAYSDRTAWLMSALSRLAYERFETDAGARARLGAVLADAGLLLLDTFDAKKTGTQAFLCRRVGEFGVLVFRGTEKDRKDILNDLRARFFATAHGKAHEGFTVAYESVHSEIARALKSLEAEEPLFVTGHSLGGALATVATQELEKDHLIGACYTFGSPRVGGAEWSDCVKAPVYRVVNGADVVPLVPGGTVLRWVLTMIPNLPALTWLEKPVGRLVQLGYVGYQHAGDLRFISGQAADAKLKIGSAASWARFRHIVLGQIGRAIKALNPKSLAAAFSDHSIAHYEEKLRRIAEDRNRNPA